MSGRAPLTGPGRGARAALGLYGALALVFLYLPLVAVGLASVSQRRNLSFPIQRYSFGWYADALASDTVRELALTSLTVALWVAALSVVIGFFGALAFARYDWRGRRTFQKLALLPLFFPQAVLGLSLLMWFNALGITPSWRTAVVAHLVWISPVATLIIAIRAYGLDPALEDAARDMGCSTWTTLREVTIPLLAPGMVSAALFAFLLSWGNFPLSLFTMGVDATLPKWLYARMVSGYTPLVPTVGMLSVFVSAALVAAGLLALALRARLRR